MIVLHHLAAAALADDLTVVDAVDGLVRGCVVLSSRFGRPIVFEGAPPTEKEEAAFRANDRAAIDAIYGLRFAYPAGATALEAVTRMVDTWNLQDDGPDYVVSTSVGRAIHVRPATGSPLDTRVTLPKATGTTSELYRLVLAELTRGGVPVVDAMAGHDLDGGTVQVTLPRRTASAAELLDEVLLSTDRMGTWHLLKLTAARGGAWRIAFVVNLPQNEWTLNRAPLVTPPAGEPPVPPWEDPNPSDRVSPDSDPWLPPDERPD